MITLYHILLYNIRLDYIVIYYILSYHIITCIVINYIVLLYINFELIFIISLSVSIIYFLMDSFYKVFILEEQVHFQLFILLQFCCNIFSILLQFCCRYIPGSWCDSAGVQPELPSGGELCNPSERGSL